jgi:hypothetical protein
MKRKNQNSFYPSVCARASKRWTRLLQKLPKTELLGLYGVICDQTPRNESLCAFEKSEKKGKVKQIFLAHMMYFIKIDQLRYPDMTALQTCYNINADWHTIFLEAIAFPLF